jgi:hypothetical protein
VTIVFTKVLRLEEIVALPIAMTVFAKECCADDSVFAFSYAGTNAMTVYGKTVARMPCFCQFPILESISARFIMNSRRSNTALQLKRPFETRT